MHPGSARYPDYVSPSDSPATTQYAATCPTDAPTNFDIDVSLRATVGALLEAARAAIVNDDHAGVVTCVGAAKDLLDAMEARS